MKFYTNVTVVKNNILYRGIDDSGRRVEERIPYKPHLFIHTKNQSKFKTLDGRDAEKIQMGSITQAKDFFKRYEHVPNFEVLGNEKYIYQFLGDHFPGTVAWDVDKIKVATLDIEVASENGFPDPKDAAEEVLVITVRDSTGYYVFGTGDFVSKEKNVNYLKCRDEAELLSKFMEFWKGYYPDVITGWNVIFFDIPYLIRRISSILGTNEAKRFSPWGMVHERTVTQYQKTTTIFNISGIAILDYLELYRKFTYSAQEKYTLGHIAFVEGVGEKIDYSQFDNLHSLYKKDYQLYVEYNIKDVELVYKLENKMKLIELALTMAYDAKVNYMDVFSQVRMWDTIIYNHLCEHRLVMPAKKNYRKDSMYTGAYVKDPVVGFHEWVVLFDLNSLYPHLIMQYNISPETLITDYPAEEVSVESMLKKENDLSYLKTKKMTLTPNNQLFSTEKQGFLPEIMEKMYQDRVSYKKQLLNAKIDLENNKDKNGEAEIRNRISKYNNLQMAKKIQLNSAYGALGNQWFRFYDVRQAEAVTLSGQLSIRWIENALNEYLNDACKTTGHEFVVASDTDSVYLCLDLLMKELDNIIALPESKADKIKLLEKYSSEIITPFIEKKYKELSEYTNAFQQKMEMGMELIADKGIWTAKKRYILNVHNEDGLMLAEPKLKMKGIEAIKSSTPSACRDKIKEALKIIMNNDEDTLKKFIKDFREEFDNLLPEDIAFPRSVNNLTKYFVKGMIQKATPIHVRGSIIYNTMLKEMKLDKKYPVIQSGEKIKFMYLKEPNPTLNNVIAFPSGFPAEFHLNKYFDRELQFSKSFLEPLKIILNAIDWEVEDRGTLESLFE